MKVLPQAVLPSGGSVDVSTKANRSGDNLENVENWQDVLGIQTVEDLAAARNAAAPREGVELNGSQSFLGSVAEIGTNPFTIRIPLVCPKINPTVTNGLFTITTGINDFFPHSIFCVVLTNGDLQLVTRGVTLSDSRRATISGFVSTYAGGAVDIVLRRDGAEFNIFINGKDTAYTETTTGTPPTWANTVNGTNFYWGTVNPVNTNFTGVAYPPLIFNRALTAQEIADRYASGVWVPSAEQWGEVKYTSDLTSSVDGWSNLSGFNQTFAATTGWAVVNGTGSSLFPLRTSGTAGLLNIRIKGKVGFTGAGTKTTISIFTESGTATSLLSSLVSADTEYDFDVALLNTASTNRIGWQINVAVGVSVYFKDIVVEVLGATLSLRPQGLGRQLLDVSANRNHALCTTEPSYTVPKLSAVIRSEAQSLTNGTTILATDILPTDSPVTGVTIGNATLPMLATAQDLATRTLTIGRDGSDNVVVNRNGVAITGPLASAPATADVEIRYMKA